MSYDYVSWYRGRGDWMKSLQKSRIVLGIRMVLGGRIRDIRELFGVKRMLHILMVVVVT